LIYDVVLVLVVVAVAVVVAVVVEVEVEVVDVGDVEEGEMGSVVVVRGKVTC
jgi:hypothetical protein